MKGRWGELRIIHLSPLRFYHHNSHQSVMSHEIVIRTFTPPHSRPPSPIESYALPLGPSNTGGGQNRDFQDLAPPTYLPHMRTERINMLAGPPAHVGDRKIVHS